MFLLNLLLLKTHDDDNNGIFAVASQAERDHFRYQRKETRLRVQRSCDGEMEREVHAVLGPVGVEEKLSRQLATSLLLLEDQQNAANTHSNNSGSDEAGKSSWFGSWMTSNKKQSAANDAESSQSLRWSEDVGLTAFLLKFGEGLGTFMSSSLLF